MKKLLSLCLVVAVSCSFAGTLDSLSSAVTNPNTLKCINSCDAGILLRVLGKSNSKSGNLSKTACKVGCTDSCFSSNITDGKSTEMASISCKTSLMKTFASK
ncbi:MAG: hypothetical protein ACK5Z5_06935 [Neisseriaceae bacterium]